MTILHAVYAVYFLLAGVAGLALYPGVLRICYGRLLDRLSGLSGPNETRPLLVSCAAIVGCTVFVEVCFSRAAALVVSLL